MTNPRSAALFEQQVLCHLDVVFRVARHLTGRPHEAKDLVQETFLRAHRGFAECELKSHGGKSWLLKILHNTFVNQLRQTSVPSRRT
jgi:RNA polymerase sigma-70 factor (ECF subfamily)